MRREGRRLAEQGTHPQHSLRFELLRPAASRTPVSFVDGFVETPHKADEVNPVVDDLFFDCNFGKKLWKVERWKFMGRGVAASRYLYW